MILEENLACPKNFRSRCEFSQMMSTTHSCKDPSFVKRRWCPLVILSTVCTFSLRRRSPTLTALDIINGHNSPELSTVRGEVHATKNGIRRIAKTP